MENKNKSEVVPEAAMELYDRPRIAPVGPLGKKGAVSKPEKKTLSEKEALDLSKDDQVALLEKLGAEDIPRYEKDRVALILKLQ